jgi:hypothetical protein
MISILGLGKIQGRGFMPHFSYTKLAIGNQIESFFGFREREINRK